METREGLDTVETFQGTGRDRTALWRYLRAVVAACLEALALGGEGMDTGNVFEKEDKFVVKAELPGMREDDIDVSVVGDTLTIKGEKKTEAEVKEDDYYHCERSYGSFFRSVALPSHVDAKKIEASYEEGVLEITLPKVPEVKPKKVPVTVKKAVSAKKEEKASK